MSEKQDRIKEIILIHSIVPSILIGFITLSDRSQYVLRNNYLVQLMFSLGMILFIATFVFINSYFERKKISSFIFKMSMASIIFFVSCLSAAIYLSV